jgi:hypothetical protein
MRRFSGRPTVGVVSGLVLLMAACSPATVPGRPGTGGKGGTGGSAGSGGQPGTGGVTGTGGSLGTGGQGGSGQAGAGGSGGTGTGGQGGSAAGGQGGSGGMPGDAGREARPGGRGGAGGTGGAGGMTGDARVPDMSSPGDGGLAALDAFCTPKVILMIDPGAGGMRFMMALGGTNEAVIATVQQMGREICRYLYRSADEVRPANEIELIVDPAYTGIAGKSGNVGKVRVRFGASYLANYQGEVAREVKGILYHEMTHIYQHDDKPEGLGAGGWPGLAAYYESHADAVRTHFGYTSCRGAPSKTGSWDMGAYCARAHWWLWLDNQYPGFLYKLNLQMKGGDNMIWTPARGATIANKSFEALWTEYQGAACCAGTNLTCCK